MTQPQRSVDGCNDDYPWDKFDPEKYFQLNYVDLRDDDRRIVEIVRDFFAETFAVNPLPSGARGIDVGTGANLYPALAMLPFCDRITLYELSASNVTWLENQLDDGWPSWNQAWDQFWMHLRKQSSYRSLMHPRVELSTRVDIVKGSIFELQEPAHLWDVGTMFFVAESITGRPEEFMSAVDHFFAVLKPDAPFAMAFMEHSAGYHIGGQKYPATDIDESDVACCLRERAHNIGMHHLGSGDKPLRDGYSGMIIAHGRAGHPK